MGPPRGPTLPRLGIGNWHAYDAGTPVAEIVRLLSAAREVGVGWLDTAATYQGGDAEAQLGRALRVFSRDSFLIATKGGADAAGHVRLDAATLERSLVGSLRRLGRDAIDVYQVHHFDPATPLDETLSTLARFVERGLVRSYSCANFGPLELLAAEDAAARCGVPRFSAVQARYNVLERRRGDVLFPVARAVGAQVVAYSVLAEGLLTGRYRDGIAPNTRGARDREFRAKWWTPPWRARAHAFVDAARRLGHDPAELAVSFVADDPRVSTIVLGARTTEQLVASAAAARRSNREPLREVLAALERAEAATPFQQHEDRPS